MRGRQFVILPVDSFVEVGCSHTQVVENEGEGTQHNLEA